MARARRISISDESMTELRKIVGISRRVSCDFNWKEGAP
jgi:hypothetical protein